MVRNRISLVASLLAVIFAVTTIAHGDADARRKKRRKKKRAPVAHINQEALGELMGPFTFGMTKKQILKILSKQINEQYAEKIKETTDVYTQDKLRRKEKAEIRRIQKTYVEFTGKKTGWDVSIIDDQFTRNTDEAMMVYWENSAETGKDQRRFFFFHNGRLYKMFIQLGSSMLKEDQRSFDYFKDIMQRRYGNGQVSTRVRSGEEVPYAIHWRAPKYHVFALDKLEFYNSFCLVIADPVAEKELDDVRAANKVEAKSSNVINSVIVGKDEDDTPSLDQDKNVIDNVTR